ncbi:tetratricopeptide repeat protein [Candidatus Venteria ishoeyi]|uniref:tetratricopeptide repeat protein n=1 Tax=Candidatus Venteria ishoeyi TaxID=1899563 RepID=UPI0025A5F0C3|nr:tetratricopeptide repeat protein [Candidatus Venteria ishoeyi]MDM8547351.1 tetratricopeptide repeat protein [Candidatus Venteria ishoeyi]
MGDKMDLPGDFRGATVYIKSTVNGVTTERAIPLHRPPRAAHFTDRVEALAKLLQDLRPGNTATLCGPGGIGKTALATEAIWTLAPDNKAPELFPDGIFFHSFYNEPSADVALEWIARAYDVDSQGMAEQAARHALSGRHALLVLDGAEDADDLRKVQSVAGNCGVLVTSRKRQDAIDQRQDMQPLKQKDALKLLHEWADRQIDNEQTAQQICQLLGGLPLAVRLVGRYLNETEETSTEYLAWLEKMPLEALDPDNEHHRHASVPYLLERSLAQVSETARDVLALVGLLAMSPFDQEIIRHSLQLSEGDLRKAMRDLIGYGLLQREDGRYQVSHALIHTYTRESLPLADAVFENLVNWYIDFAKTESAKGLAGYQGLHPERPHLLYLLDNCMQRQAWQLAENISRAIENYLDIQGYWAELIIVQQTGLEAACKLENKRNEGVWLGNLGNTYRALGQVEKAIAYQEQALLISREIGDKSNEGNQLGNLGNAYYVLGQVEKAIAYHEQALLISREIGDRRNEGAWLGNLGNAYSALGQVEKAIAYHEQALLISREIGDKSGEGADLGNLGNAYSALGQVEKAIDYHEQALLISREIGDKSGEGADLGNLGNAYSALGQVEKAIDYHENRLCLSAGRLVTEAVKATSWATWA